VKEISIEDNSKRAAYINELYQIDDRNDINHPYHGLFTGLHQEILTYEKFKRDKEIYEKWKDRSWRRQEKPTK
tara:strand:+ start:787 stop:1005 length:219 start_codon:yes stop_codon:yes gene_type:complete